LKGETDNGRTRSLRWPIVSSWAGVCPKGLCKNNFRFWRERRPAPEGWGDFAFWLRFSSVAEPWLCSFVVPRQKAKSPPAKPEFIFAQTLRGEIMTWAEICEDRFLTALPYRIETNRWGQVVMSPPPRREHAEFRPLLLRPRTLGQ